MRRVENDAVLLNMHTLSYSEVALDGRQSQKAKLNDLTEKLNRLERDNQQLLLNQCKLHANNCNLKNSVKQGKDEIENLLKTIEVIETNKNHDAKIESEETKTQKLETDLKKTKDENEQLKTAVATEKEKREDAFATILMLKAEISKLTRLLKQDEQMKTQYTTLREKVAHFAVEVKEKQRNVPMLGQNNIEDFEVQKFVNFLTRNVQKLGDLVPNGLTSSSPQDSLSIVNRFCKLCQKQTQFAKCPTESCEEIYHEECIELWYQNRQECPSCRDNSIPLEEYSDSQ